MSIWCNNLQIKFNHQDKKSYGSDFNCPNCSWKYFFFFLKKRAKFGIYVICKIFLHSYVSQQADKHSISLVWSIRQQAFPSPDGKDRISTAYISSLLPYNFVDPDSGMYVNLSLSICLHLIKHMLKSLSLFLKSDAFRKRDLEWCYSLLLTLNLVSGTYKLQFRKKSFLISN